MSEGQAYGLLIAELADQPATARSIWTWTNAHLRRPDGLLAFHANADGHVEDDNAAGDADVLTAFALLRYRGPGAAELHRQGASLARAVLDHETATVNGSPVVVAGNWALGPPTTVNPSYWMPGVFAALGAATGDGRWARAAATTVDLLRQATDDGQRLPPDWAHLQDGRLTPIAAPDGSVGVRYGLDAARVPLWLAAGCSAAARQLSASWWRNVLSAEDRAAYLALSLTGAPMDRTVHPVPLLAAAAAAGAAGDRNRAAALRARAVQQSVSQPTYYGDAWVALAAGLDNRSLAGQCA